MLHGVDGTLTYVVRKKGGESMMEFEVVPGGTTLEIWKQGGKKGPQRVFSFKNREK